MSNETNNNLDLDVKSTPAKRAYVAPTLTDVGSISALTRGSFPTNNNDGSGMMNGAPCL